MFDSAKGKDLIQESSLAYRYDIDRFELKIFIDVTEVKVGSFKADRLPFK